MSALSAGYHHTRWTRQEHDTLFRMWEGPKSALNIAGLLGRTPKAVMAHFYGYNEGTIPEPAEFKPDPVAPATSTSTTVQATEVYIGYKDSDNDEPQWWRADFYA